MRSACLILILTGSLTAQSPVSLKAVRSDGFLVVKDVFLNGMGPFRMVVDTGNASSLIRPRVARRLEARAVYAVEQVTAAIVGRRPVVMLDRVTTGALTERRVEAIVGDVGLEGVDGVLGQSWLARHDYLLDYRKNLMVVDDGPPEGGLMIALHSADGCPSISARVDGRATELVLDSGASTVVLFDCAPQPRLMMTLLTNSGSAAAGETSIRIALPGGAERKMRAVCASSPEHRPGLLPASAFAAIFVSNRERQVYLIR